MMAKPSFFRKVTREYEVLKGELSSLSLNTIFYNVRLLKRVHNRNLSL